MLCHRCGGALIGEEITYYGDTIHGYRCISCGRRFDQSGRDLRRQSTPEERFYVWHPPKLGVPGDVGHSLGEVENETDGEEVIGMEEEKKCMDCGKSKPLTTEYFQINKATPDGFDYRCKPCRHEFQKERREGKSGGRKPAKGAKKRDYAEEYTRRTIRQAERSAGNGSGGVPAGAVMIPKEALQALRTAFSRDDQVRRMVLKDHFQAEAERLK